MLNWNLAKIRLLCVWYPVDILDILISGVQISSKVLPLGQSSKNFEKTGGEQEVRIHNKT